MRKIIFNMIARPTIGYVLLTLFLQLNITNAYAEMAKVPLFLSASVDPNIVFVLDDSGSMHWELMPDDLIHSYYLFPRATSIYGAGDYTNYVPTFEDGYGYSALARCPLKNILYYNPAITYTPWSNSDGSLFANAAPDAAYHNPKNVTAGTRDLTSNNTQSAHWVMESSVIDWNVSTEEKTFYPAIYFRFNGGDDDDELDFSNYTKIEIRSTTATYSGDGRDNRADCTSGSCTYTEEIQNFANWYTYYRSRILAARAGIGRAFSQQTTGLRVGFATLNKGLESIDGVSTEKMISGVRPFIDTDRTTFFNNLYTHAMPTSGTPLREALDAIGQYYQRTDNPGPWGKIPGTDDSTSQLSCRGSYTILMTDGYWNGAAAGTAAAQANNDGTAGPTTTGPNDQSYTYEAVSPFTDDNSSTLADVAMYYWKRDLRTSISNRVPVSTIDPAFWQHMVTFGIGLGVQGSVDPQTAFDAIYTQDSVVWDDPSSDAAKIDDLLHAGVNSRGGFFSAADPDTFATALSDTLENIVTRTVSSASAIATNSTRLVDESLIFQARFDSRDWSGELRAYEINNDGSIGDVHWTTDTTGLIPSSDSRNILSWDGGTGIEFEWDDLSDDQKAYLTEDKVDWIRGDQSKEAGQEDGTFRQRDNLLGDIVNSDPFVVGVPNFRYELLSTGVAGQDTYEAYRESIAARPRMLYVGGNDGMLHALNATTGSEVFAYVPNGVYENLADLTDTDYTHQYYVDGSPIAGDAYIDGAWTTIMVGSLGAGGRSVFALDVTDPNSFDDDNVLWEFGYDSTKECIADVTGCKDMGYSFGKATVARMQNGEWAVIFANGYGSDSHKAKLFIVNAENGKLISTIDAGSDGDATTPNGLSTPVFLVDANRTITTAYAGDLLGHVWKFDLSDASPSNWAVAINLVDTPQPLFSAPSNQAITAPVEIGSNANGDNMIYFGTGKYFEIEDNDVSNPSTNPGIQSFYGIVDVNKKTTQTNLTQQFIIAEGELSDDNEISYRVVSDNDVSFSDNTPGGWYLNLVSPVNVLRGERVVSAPLLRRGKIVFTTLIPGNDPCLPGGTSWLMELDTLTGGRYSSSVLDVDGDETIDANDKVIITIDGQDVSVTVSGRLSEVGIIKTPAVIENATLEHKYFGGSSGQIEMVREIGGDEDSFGRQSWRQLR